MVFNSFKEYYETYEEALQAVQRLNIGSSREYNQRYKEDPKLPSVPLRFYKGKGWVDWCTFLGKYYETYEEASQAVQKLNIESGREYQKRHKEDSKLPSAPLRFYKGKGWVDWYTFLGK